ncbi:hypothetical protein ACPYO6_00765 [Georgenia sp. Z1344]|uniref:hypothetical protein n=1 Tax=Georgenia sp. Z1344 TaxID=3416706 RepID=UPI003CF0882F
MTTSTVGHRRLPRRRSVRALAAIAVAGVALAGCSIRIDSDPEPPPAATATQQWRQDVAVETAGLAEAARTLAADPSTDPAVAEAVEGVAADLDAQVEALGGVWVAWPDGPPEGQTNAPLPEAPVVADVTELRGLLSASADSTIAILADVPAAERDLASVLAATATGRILAALELEQHSDGGTPVEVTPMTPEVVAAVADGPTVLVLDQARYLEEILAARGMAESAPERADQLQVLVDTAIEAGAQDTREPAYPWPDGDADAFRAVTEADLLDQWIFLAGTAPAEQRGALVDAAADAAVRLQAAGVDPGALPGLPGSAGAESASESAT